MARVVGTGLPWDDQAEAEPPLGFWRRSFDTRAGKSSSWKEEEFLGGAV